MQITETVADGLKREFEVVVPAAELDQRLVERLSTMKAEVRLKGFRPGKVPISHLRRLYGRSAMAEIVQSVLAEVARDTLEKRGEKAAMQPDFKLPEDEGLANKVLAGDADLTYTMAVDVLPKIELADFKKFAVERMTAKVTDAALDERVNKLAESARSYTTKLGAAAVGDQVTISYLGKIDGEVFEGGSDDNAVVKIGDGRFIPGFAEQLVGVKTDDRKTITVTFTTDYQAAQHAGKEAVFEVEVKAVAEPDDLEIDDSLAERLGLESLDALKDAVRQQIKAQYEQAARQKLKRKLLDQLEESHDFELPPGLVDQEFDTIWRQVSDELANSSKTFADEDTTEEEARQDYRKIAARRVRLGLVMSEIGEANTIEVTEEEVQRALSAQLRQFPGREQALMDYYRNNPDAVVGLRAPIFEEKVVDYLLELVAVTEREVPPEELLSQDADEDGNEPDE